ncbi:MAG: hypothetical protein ACI835_004786, partial [Planctomycetota bacterium]
YPLEDGQSVESVVSMALSAKACALHINGKKRDARKLAKEAIQLSPDDSELVARLDSVLNK